MNKVITINLNGIAYQLEESGYEALRAYLANAARRLEGNPDKDEIIADIEQAIADKFRALLGPYKTVVITKEVTAVIAEMGPVEDASKPEPTAGTTEPNATDGPAGAGATGAAGEPRTARRLYRVQDGAMVAGVCNGLAAYFNIDPTIVRIAFVLLTLVWGTGLLVYFLLALLIPSAKTPAEKAAASGMAATAQEFIRRAKEGYYEGMKTWHDKQAHRAWKRKFKQEMRGWKYRFEREAQEHVHQWQQNWPQPWQHYPRFPLGAVFVAPILSLLLLALFLACGYSIFKLVTAGVVFGLALPAGIPLWVGVVFLLVVFHCLSWPLKAMRYACYYPPMVGGCYRPHSGPLDGLVWLALFVGLIFVADHYSPQFHQWLKDLPAVLQHAGDTVREWWARR
jgi:phage shock protein PspC (stress-responsive transcriptional regulator)